MANYFYSASLSSNIVDPQDYIYFVQSVWVQFTVGVELNFTQRELLSLPVEQNLPYYETCDHGTVARAVVVRSILSKWFVTIWRSGNKQGYRHRMVKSAIDIYESMVEEDNQGVKPMYRPREWRKNERLMKKFNRGVDWYRKSAHRVKTYEGLLISRSVALQRQMCVVCLGLSSVCRLTVSQQPDQLDSLFLYQNDQLNLTRQYMMSADQLSMSNMSNI